LLGLQIPGLVGSSVLIESVFAWPGLGTLSINSALFRDYPVFMGTALLYAAAVVVSSTGADLAYAVVNPRVRHG
jgi:ABC-type dipeptide/oligopeptide/nickel transport system permease component